MWLIQSSTASNCHNFLSHIIHRASSLCMYIQCIHPLPLREREHTLAYSIVFVISIHYSLKGYRLVWFALVLQKQWEGSFRLHSSLKKLLGQERNGTSKKAHLHFAFTIRVRVYSTFIYYAFLAIGDTKLKKSFQVL